MAKSYPFKNTAEGSNWMLLGSKFARVLNPLNQDLRTGTVVKMSRNEYQVQSDGSVRRVTGKRRTRKKSGVLLTR